MLDNRRKIRNFLVDSKAQFRLALSFLIFLICSSSLVIYLFITTSSVLDNQQIDIANTELLAMITQLKMRILMISTGGVAILGLLCGALWAAASHRIFGPMVQIHQQLDRFLKGDYNGHVKLRKLDEFHDLAEKLNQLAQKLGKGN